MRIGRIKVLTLFCLINYKTLLAHDLEKCPPQWQWKLRAKAFCNTLPEQYSCLYDVIQKIYKESCSGIPDYVKPGKRYVIRGERDNDDCRDPRYQPLKLWSNRSSECEFNKNKCNEMGQLIYSNGSTTKDRTCRCDYTKGFDFVMKPMHVCYCIPSEEDCSCYQKTCRSEELPTKEYVCDSKVIPDVKDGRCFPIVGIRNPSFGSTSTSRPTPSLADDSDKNIESHIKSVLPVLTVVFVFIPSLIIFMMVLCITMRINTKKKQNRSADMIIINKTILIEEMEPEMIYHELQRKKHKIKIPDSVSRGDKAKIIYKFLENASNEIICTFYKILRDGKKDFLLEILEESDKIFRYDREERLKQRIENHFKEIVDCLYEEKSVDRIISILKEDGTLHQDVVATYEKFKNDVKENISEIIKLVIEKGLKSMLLFVYALFIIDMYKTHKQTKDQQATAQSVTQELVREIVSSHKNDITKENCFVET